MRNVDPPVVLALSGGGDSMALLLIAAGWARTRGRRLLALTIDHGLNPSSADWGRRCSAAAAALGVDWIGRTWDGDRPLAGLTAAARAARHALIAEAARGAGARVILMAHTADDVAESDWMRDRGSTLGRLREWSPSPAWPEGRTLMLLRPMLEERREALRDLLRREGVAWVEDPANGDPRFGRARARSALAGFSVGERMTSAAPMTQTVPSVRPDPLPLGAGFRLARDVGKRALAATLLCASGRSEPVKGRRLDRLADHLRSGAEGVATLSGARVEGVGADVLIGREAGEFARHPVPYAKLAVGVAAVWDGRYAITARDEGWSVGPAAGRLGRLSDKDRAIVRTLPAWARGALPVLIRDGGDAPVLAWRQAEVRALAPRRLRLAIGGAPGETTHEANLFDAIHGETPPTDLFSPDDHHDGAPHGLP